VSRFGASRSPARLVLEVQRLSILSAMASIARQQDPEALRLLDAFGGEKSRKRARRSPSETDWERYRARLDASVSHAGATVIALFHASAKGSRIAQVRQRIHGLFAAYEQGPRVTRASVLRVSHGQQMVLSLWELPSGKTGRPYEHRLAHDQLVVVIDGRLILRTQNAPRVLRKGEVVACVPAETASRTLANPAQEGARFLVLGDVVCRRRQ
jgi:quercetin dioxygenase-like cupin family protein